MNPDAGGRAGQIASNVVYFARTLRGAGLPAGPDRVVDAVEALKVTGIGRRDDVFWLFHALFVSRPEQSPVFAEIFHLFWSDPERLEHMLALERSVHDAAPRGEATVEAGSAGIAPQDNWKRSKEERDEPESGQPQTWSARETLRGMDFADMSSEEIAEARQAVARMRLEFEPLPRRRLKADPSGNRIDMRAALRQAARQSGGMIPLPKARQDSRPPAVVLLCDVSGSMIDYSRMLIRLAHALTTSRRKVHSFTFGTRLTNITRDLENRDTAASLASLSRKVEDWSGGTRIGECLRTFNRDWARRVLVQGAVVILVTDGLDRDVTGCLGREMAMLRRSCRKLVWLNPLLRWHEFRPRTWGIRTMLPHVDAFRTCHNLASLEDLAQSLGGPIRNRTGEMERWLKAI